MSEFNPLLAAEGVLGQITYPMGLMPKHNGVRGACQKGMLVARSLKLIPNVHARNLFSHPDAEDMEGELVVGAFDDEEVFSISTSGVMSRDGQPDVHWYLFDTYHPTATFTERYQMLVARQRLLPMSMQGKTSVVPLHVINSDEELTRWSEHYLSLGFEGVVLKKLDARYKTGRSTAKEQTFMRYCPWHTSEAIILSVEEGQINNNVSKVNELGYLRKSSHKANKVGSGQAGSVTVQDLKTGIQHSMIVPTDLLQKQVWLNTSMYIGKVVKYKFKPPVIKGGKPRFPQWEGLRDPLDM